MFRLTLVTLGIVFCVMAFNATLPEAEAGGRIRDRIRGRYVNEQPEQQQQPGGYYTVERYTYTGPQAPSFEAVQQQQQGQKPKAAAPALVWGNDYDAACRQGSDEGKTVVILFTASTCPHCPRQDAILNDPSLSKALGECVLAKVQSDANADNQALADSFGIAIVPSLLVIRAGGNPVVYSGVQSANQIANYLNPPAKMPRKRTAEQSDRP